MYFQYIYQHLVKYISNLPSTVSSAYLDFNIYHLYHGSIQNREYVSRHTKIHKVLEDLNVVGLDKCTEYNEHGIMLWRSAYRSELNSFLKEYLISRNDDSI